MNIAMPLENLLYKFDKNRMNKIAFLLPTGWPMAPIPSHALKGGA
jgi:hypothetical protein